MQKRNTITLTKADVLRMLAKEGIEIPSDDCYMGMEEDGSSIEIHWTETITRKLPKPLALSDIPFDSANQIHTLVEQGERLLAIKALRSCMGWGLIEAKDWIMKHYPR